MKTIKITLVLALLGMFTSVGLYAQGTPEYNLEVTQNDRTVGGTLRVMLQVRAIGSSFDIGSGNVRVVFNGAALSVPTVDNTNSDIQGLIGGTAFMNVTGVNNPDQPVVGYNRYSVNLVLNNFTSTPNGPTIDTGTYSNIGELVFTINSLTDRMDMEIMPNDGLPGNTVTLLEDNIATNFGGIQHDQVIFNGTTWSGGNGVAGAPDATDAVKEIIVQSGTATLSGDVECEYFTVAGGAQLVVGPNATLRPFVQDATVGYSITDGVDGFLIDADATGYGQYIGPGVTGQIKQWIGTDAGWRNAGFPVSGGTALDIAGGTPGFNAASTSYNASPDCAGTWGNVVNTVSVYTFDQGPQPQEWYGASAAPTGGTVGYNIFSGPFFGTSGELSIKGTFYEPATVGTYSYTHDDPHASASGSQSAVTQGPGCITELPADRKANWDGWALVANPYPCNMDVDEFASDNSLSAANVKVFNRTTGLYEVKSGATIAPMQAFWVKTGTAGFTDNLVFQDDIRTFSPAATFNKKNGVLPGFNLSVTHQGTGQQDRVTMQFDPTASEHYDHGLDAYDIMQPDSSFPQLAWHHTYTGSNGNPVIAPLLVHTVALPRASHAYPLRLQSGGSGRFSFELDSANMRPEWEVYIEDRKLAPGVHHRLDGQATYTFNYQPGDSATRFWIHFVSNTVGLDEDALTEGELFAYEQQEQLYVGFEDLSITEVDLRVYNAAGQLVHEAEAVTTDEPYHLPLEHAAQNLWIIKARAAGNRSSWQQVVKVIY